MSAADDRSRMRETDETQQGRLGAHPGRLSALPFHCLLRITTLFFLSCLLAAYPRVGSADDPTRLWQDAQQAARRGEHREAIAACNRLLAADPDFSAAYYLRGREQFRAGDADASLRDFDRYLEHAPSRAASLWERGISCFYAGQYEEGAKQFTAYQGYDSTDVENAVWHFLCQHRAAGLDTARRSLLPIKQDGRIPLMTIYDLYRGVADEQDVLKAAGQPAANAASQRSQWFYAHLYLGIYADICGQPDKAKQHLEQAVNRYAIGHYMDDVAQFHLNRIRQQAADTGKEPTSEGNSPSAAGSLRE